MPDMRFAPPNPIRIADRVNGLNAVSVRSHNERLVLALLLQHGGSSRVEIGERTGLSAQTVSVIVRSLENEGLVARGEAQRGRVGPPTIPLSLNPRGAFAVGISIGYRKTEVVLIDFVGTVCALASLPHPSLGHDFIHPDLVTTVARLVSALDANDKARVAGVGLALPEGMQDSEELAAVQLAIEGDLGLEIFLQNDVTAATSGESLFGIARELDDYLFFYIGAHVHSRLVLKHQIYNNRVSAPDDAGLLEFERMLGSNTTYVDELWSRASELLRFKDCEEEWKQACARLITHRVGELRQFVDVRTIVISSYIPAEVCADICTLVSQNCTDVEAVAGTNRGSPKAIGAAGLPFASRFTVDYAS